MEKVFRFDDVPVIETKEGKLRGYSYDSMHIFKGIPYAQAKRFQMPTKVEPWEGVKDVHSYGYVCPLLQQDKPLAEIMVPHRYWPQDENCQNLNIWTDSLDKNAKRPVMVWFHGGGFVAGSSIEQEAYDGFQMCRHGEVVVVSVNHRLNVLGYLDLSPFGEKYKNSANGGHADLVAALEWIHENIASFGGDPENVTLFGQSGGGMKAADLMQIPAADGLFHKAIVMSGVSDGVLMPEPKGDGRQIVTAMLKELGLDETEVEKLETLSYHDLAQAYNKVSMSIAMQGGYIGGMPVKNEFYVGAPLIHGFTEHAKTIPLMVGSVFGEFAFKPIPFNKYEMTEEEMKGMLAETFQEGTDEIASLFQEAYPGKKILDLLSLDRIFRVPSKNLAGLMAKTGNAPAYLYHFTLEFPFQYGKPAWHCSDIPFFFHNTSRVEVCGIPNVAKKLEQQIFQAVIHFSKNGDPNHDELPQWSPVTAEKETTMIFDRECEARYNYDDALLTLHEELSPPFSLAAMMSEDIQH